MTMDKDNKPESRIEYFQSYLNQFILISWGSIVALLAFISNKQNPEHMILASIGVTSLVLAVLSSLLILFLNYIAHGFFWDYKNSNAKDDISYNNANRLGKIMSAAVVISLFIFLPVGLISSVLFALFNS